MALNCHWKNGTEDLLCILRKNKFGSSFREVILYCHWENILPYNVFSQVLEQQNTGLLKTFTRKYFQTKEIHPKKQSLIVLPHHNAIVHKNIYLKNKKDI